MDYNQGRTKFIKSWGDLGANWGINKTMGQIHALLLISEQPKCCESIMKELEISRGNANMNLRALIDWKLAFKHCEDGCRKEFFTAEKDIWMIFRMITKKRKEKELKPLMALVDELNTVEGNSDEAMEFKKFIGEIDIFSKNADATLERVIQSKSNFLLNTVSKILR